MSFAGSDISKITFTDRVKWGGKDHLMIIEEEWLERNIKYFPILWKNITTSSSDDSSKFKDFLKYIGVNWKGELQFVREDHNESISAKDSSNYISIDDKELEEVVDNKGSYFIAKKQKPIHSLAVNPDYNNMKANLKIDDGVYYEFSLRKEKGNIVIFPSEGIALDLVLYVYRRLRENYEFNLKFGEAGTFFIKEMELKRKYRTISGSNDLVKKNDWFRRHFSLTGLYYHFSTYGESIKKPTAIGAITVGLSTLFWLLQSKPTLEPHFFIDSSLYHSMSHFVYLNQAGNSTRWLVAFQRSLADFLPVLSLPSDIKVVVHGTRFSPSKV